MAQVGICALCRAHGELCDSHLWLPKFAYKRLREPSAQNPNPVEISAKGVRQTSSQQVKPLLCSRCENERFNKLGEHWVSKVCLQDNNVTFPLLDLLKTGPQQVLDQDNGAFYTASILGLQHVALEYFAASMVWRGQFISSRAKPASYSLRHYESQFTDYLLGHAGFPIDASLLIFIRYRSNLTQVSYGVRVARSRMASLYSFSIPGIMFQLALGSHRDSRLDEVSFNPSPLRPILDIGAVDVITNDMLVEVKEKARLRGRRSTLTVSP